MTHNSVYTPTPGRSVRTPVVFLSAAGVALAVWAGTVVWASLSGLLSQIPPAGVVLTVGAGIAAPTLLYLASHRIRGGVEWIGLRGLTGFHLWRIPAALVFFWFGASGSLPPIFVGLAGVGDLLAGVLALWVVTLKAPGRAHYAFVHLFGFLDFVVAVGTGVTLTLLRDPQMQSINDLPLALIPYFGVALSGATHLMAFDLIRRNRVRRP